MKKTSQLHQPATRQTCETCIHTFRTNKAHDVVVCVPQLARMPAENASVCELYSTKDKKSRA